jgi:hypothetical protein
VVVSEQKWFSEFLCWNTCILYLGDYG